MRHCAFSPDLLSCPLQVQDSPDVDLHETRLDTSPEGWQFSDILGGDPVQEEVQEEG